MKLGIMQPYFLPYIGYFQLLNAVDEFVVYDNIKYTKKGWINRNRYLVDGQDRIMSIPLKKDADHLDVVQRRLSDLYEKEAEALKRRISAAYRGAPFFDDAYPVFLRCVDCEERNLFGFLRNSIEQVADYLSIDTKIITSSTIGEQSGLKSQDRVLAICERRGADQYINAIGGRELYDKATFRSRGIELSFIQTDPIVYKQFDKPFVPYLSILDVMMFNSKEDIRDMLGRFSLV